jgi:hypothetical protein
MSVVTRPDIFPATTKVKLFAPSSAVQGQNIIGELIRRNTPRYIARLEATLVNAKPKLTVVGGEASKLEPGCILVGTSIPSEATLVKVLEPLVKEGEPPTETPQSTQALGPGQEVVWEMSGNAEATVEVPEIVLAYPPAKDGITKLTGYNPENWKGALKKVGEPEVASNGELIVAATVEGQGAGPVLGFAEVTGFGMRYLTMQAHLSALVKVKTTTTAVLPANPLRQGLSIVNTGANPIYLGLGKAAVLKEGVGPLKEGGSWDGRLGNELWRGAINGIAETAEMTAAISEF